MSFHSKDGKTWEKGAVVKPKSFKPDSFVPDPPAPPPPSNLDRHTARINSLRENRNEHPHWFIGTRTGHIEKQTAYIQAENTKAQTLIDTDRLEIQAMELSHEIAHLPHAQQARQELAAAQHRQAIASNDNNTATYENSILITERAGAKGLNAQSYIELEVAREREQIRLDGYVREVHADIDAITRHRLLAHLTVLGVSAHLQQLFLQRANLVALDTDEDTKTKMLAAHDLVIDAFRTNLNVTIQRHLLEAGDTKVVEGNEASPESQGDGRTDDAGGAEQLPTS